MKTQKELETLLIELVKLPKETEWVEFKHNNCDHEMIGEYISALANSALLSDRPFAYIVWGVEDVTHNLIGTSFFLSKEKKGGQDLTNWLQMLLEPRIDFEFYEFSFDEKHYVIIEIPCAKTRPVGFSGTEFLRVGSHKKKLKEFPEKERKLWQQFDHSHFEDLIAKTGVDSDAVLKLIDYPAYFEVTKQPLPDNRNGILEKLCSEKFLIKRYSNIYDITNLGAILFARNLNEFDRLSRKAIRVIQYKHNNKVETVREQTGVRGYAVGFEGALSYINSLLPQNEIVGQAFRTEMKMYPEIAIRELVANAIIHQNFNITGTGPMIELFSDRIEITNPGVPLIDTLRFLDEPPRSRNEALAAFMRRINICEERGSGVDKVVSAVEIFQLPAPSFSVFQEHTKAVLYAHKDFAAMTKDDRVRACYQHACLKYVSNDFMTNTSLRERFNIADKNYPMVSRIIADAQNDGLVKRSEDNSSKRFAKYVPFWV